ncbi:MAG: Aspartate-semialdehyde dehydrogenase [Paraeggerthella hongkongensis]|mgnify:FL=1|jgi:aspartate-semialdehyde dehydrogenase|uniref:aspartate-semialdehyde dehydrogenase n=1 Tax=Paraeggerthella TaxID=651554 RepID=UPI000DF72604|nr:MULTISPECIES: aspartate-semialdehyde dehydrogenase [Paraeggerthella]MBU5405151.1 aspartate-semialdehyde dehydrogenase [Paraeggerthella hongkongensis]MCD2433480.1 aspartate-semialdehyde dehydrogenase [Paraeggerthella hominis]RDB58502.1 aspartate-semialdehyde dehydrogenase [Paraeggerthella hongkongensis]
MAWTKEIPANPVVAIAGATGAVGAEFLQVLHDLDFPASEVRALASARSAGKALPFLGCGQVPAGDLIVQEMTPESFQGVDIALFSCGAGMSKQMRQAVVDAGAVMIDNSSAFRMDEDVPLVVPEVNPADVAWHNGVIANPNCSTIQMVVALKPLYDLSPITRVVVSTYQAASGGGAPAMEELYSQTKDFLGGTPSEDLTVEVFQHRIAFNCIPHIDVFMDDDYTKEEWKMVVETQKIMGDQNVKVAPTCVRVPVLRCHAESVNVEFADEVSVEAAREALEAFEGITVMDDGATNTYPMPGLLAGTNDTYVGRLRKDPTVEHGLAFWVVADQIRKGAALNAVQIAQLLLP